MVSKTFVNEVGVRKVKTGQRVDVGLDAYPDKKLGRDGRSRLRTSASSDPIQILKFFEVRVELDRYRPHAATPLHDDQATKLSPV